MSFNQDCSSVNQSMFLQYSSDKIEMTDPILKKEQPGKCFHGGRGALMRAFDLHQLVILDQAVRDAHLVEKIKLEVDFERELTRNLSSLSTNFLGGSTCILKGLHSLSCSHLLHHLCQVCRKYFRAEFYASSSAS